MLTLLFIIKFFGVIISGVFGFLGTIHDFKDKKGNLTKWGKLAFYGIPISIFFAGLSEFLTYYSDQLTAKEASLQAVESSRKVEKIIENLNRTLQPLKSSSIFIADLRIPMRDAEFQSYKRTLDSGIKINQTRYPELESDVSAPSVKHDKTGKQIPLTISFSENSTYFPSPGTTVNGVLSVDNINISIFKTPINPKNFEPFNHGGPISPDLNIDLFSHHHRLNNKIEPMEIEYNIDENEYFLSGLFTSEQEQWEDNSRKIISFPDLDSAQFFLSIGPLGLEDSLQDKFLKLRREFELGTFSIRFNNTEIWIDKKSLLKHVSKRGSVFWEFKYLIPREDNSK